MCIFKKPICVISYFFSLWSSCILFCKYFGNVLFSATLPEEDCFLFPCGWDVVFIHELFRMSDFYDLWRDFHTCTPAAGLQRQKGHNKWHPTWVTFLRRNMGIFDCCKLTCHQGSPTGWPGPSLGFSLCHVETAWTAQGMFLYITLAPHLLPGKEPALWRKAASPVLFHLPHPHHGLWWGRALFRIIVTSLPVTEGLWSACWHCASCLMLTISP